MLAFHRLALLACLFAPPEAVIQQNAPRSSDAPDRSSRLPVPSVDAEFRLSQLSDFHFATWVLIESASMNQLNQWAAERVDEPAVQEFARSNIEAHHRLLKQMEGLLTTSFQQDVATADERFDFGTMLQQIGQRLRDQASDETTPVAPRAGERDQGASSASNRPTEQRTAAPPSERRFGRRQPDARRDESIRRRREAVEALRANLPRVLDELGESVEAADRASENTGLAFIELKRQLGERFASSMIEELSEGPRQDITPGYLGIQLVSSLQLINTMEVAQQHASPELQDLLRQGIEDARQRVGRTRELMANTTTEYRKSPPRP